MPRFPRTSLIVPGLFAVLFSMAAAAQNRVMPDRATLAPTGNLRAAFLGMNPVHAHVDPQTGEVSGMVPDLIKELARKLGVPYTIIPAANARSVVEHLNNHTADIGFLAYDEERAKEVDFGAAFAVMFNSYIVRGDSPIEKSADVDREGVKVAAVRGQTQQLFVSSHLTKAQVRVLETMPPLPEMRKMIAAGEVDAFAVNRQRALDAQTNSAGALRALPDHFSEVLQSFIVAKGDRGKLEQIKAFVDEMRASGFVKDSIQRAKLLGVDVAPAQER